MSISYLCIVLEALLYSLSIMWTVLAILLLAVPPLYAQNLTHTNGTGGQRCPVRRCLSGRAVCRDDVCLCNAPYQKAIDNGAFACYRQNQVFTECKNDPTIINFSGEKATFQYPCRYLMTFVITNLRIRKRDQGTCTCILHSWNQKHRGKFYVGGFDMTCRIENTLLRERLDMAVKIVGSAQNGRYTYSEFSSNNFLPHGPWSNGSLDYTGAGITVKSSYDLVNNQARVIIPECGWSVTFVAYDTEAKRDQQQIPGLSVGINCALGPRFQENEHVIALAPVKFGGNKFKDITVPPQTIPQALLLRAFTNNEVQNHPDASPQCSTVGPYLSRCSATSVSLAAAQCFWMLDEPRFVRCLDNNIDVSPVLVLMEACIGHYCDFGLTCEQYKDRVASTGCGNVANIPQLARISSPTFCTN